MTLLSTGMTLLIKEKTIENDPFLVKGKGRPENDY
jgi:hypothetical protein